MKNALLFLVLAATPLAAQQTPVPVRRLIPQALEAAKDGGSDLDKNLQITISGSYHNGHPIEISLTGTGPEWEVDTVLGKVTVGGSEIPIVGTLRYTLLKAEDSRWRINHALAVRLPIPTSTMSSPSGEKATNIEFRDLVISGTSLLSDGKPVAIYRAGDDKLELVVEREE